MMDMTDPIVDKTARQLDGYGLHDYVGRATPATTLQAILRCEWGSVKLRSPVRRLYFVVPPSQLSYIGSFARTNVLFPPDHSRQSFACQHVSVGSDKLNKTYRYYWKSIIVGQHSVSD